MSTVPLLVDNTYCNSCGNYTRGRTPNLLEEFLSPLAVHSDVSLSPASNSLLRDFLNLTSAFHRHDTPIIDTNKFQANFDVQHFKPEEITVKISGDNAVTIEAKHEEKQDAHGQIYRHFVRKYVLPKTCDINKLESKLSSDGVLTISAPTIGEKTEEKIVPISKTGQPARCLENKEKK